jgi:hypothetical protein
LTDILLVHGLGLLAILTREETLFLYLLAITFPFLAGVLLRRRGPLGTARTVGVLVAPGVLIAGTCLVLRSVLAPDALDTRTLLADGWFARVENLAVSLSYSFNFLGLAEGWPRLAWAAFAGLFLASGWLLMDPVRDRRPFLLFAAGLAAALVPGAIYFRENLFLLPSCFSALLFASSTRRRCWASNRHRRSRTRGASGS